MKVLRNIFIFISLFLVLFLVSCDVTKNEGNKSDTQNIELKENIITMNVGEAIKLKSGKKDSVWNSSNTSVATITSDGVLYALSKGSTTITVSSGDLKSEVQVLVEDKETAVSLIVSGKQTLKINEETTLVPTVYGTVESFTFTYSTNDENVATVSSSGVVKGINAGICTITVKAIGSSTITKEVVIYVKDEDKEDNVINNVINNLNKITDVYRIERLIK